MRERGLTTPTFPAAEVVTVEAVIFISAAGVVSVALDKAGQVITVTPSSKARDITGVVMDTLHPPIRQRPLPRQLSHSLPRRGKLATDFSLALRCGQPSGSEGQRSHSAEIPAIADFTESGEKGQVRAAFVDSLGIFSPSKFLEGCQVWINSSL